MSQIQQLIFTSVPMGLEPGRSGYCTVARSQDLSKKEIREIEKLSVLDYSISKSSPPNIHSFRLIETKNSFFYLLSRIKSCGIDYSNRTNYIAHHVIIPPELINELPPPSHIFEYWNGWKNQWDGSPKYLNEDIFLELSKLNFDKKKECNFWNSWTGDKNNSKIPLDGHSIFRTQKNDEDKLLKLFSESLTNLKSIDKSWNYTFTTFLQPTDESIDFVWIGGWQDSPADKIGITPEIHFFDLDKFDESVTHQINSSENPTNLEIVDATKSEPEQDADNLQTNIKDELKFDRHTEETESFEEQQSIPYQPKTEKAEQESSWESIQEQEINSVSDKKPQKTALKISIPTKKNPNSKITTKQIKRTSNVQSPKKSRILTTSLLIIIFILFCVIFFLIGKLNELEKQNDYLNGIIQKFSETKLKDIQNHSPPISESSSIDQKTSEEISFDELRKIKDKIDDKILKLTDNIPEDKLNEFDEMLISRIEKLESKIDDEIKVVSDESKTEKPVLVILGKNDFTIGSSNEELKKIPVNSENYYQQLGEAFINFDKRKNFFVYFFRPSACATIVTNVPGRNGKINKKFI
jgi:hypothetical protein